MIRTMVVMVEKEEEEKVEEARRPEIKPWISTQHADDYDSAREAKHRRTDLEGANRNTAYTFPDSSFTTWVFHCPLLPTGNACQHCMNCLQV